MYRLRGDLLLDVHVPMGIGVELSSIPGRAALLVNLGPTHLRCDLPFLDDFLTFWFLGVLLLLGRDGYHFCKDLEAGNDTTSALLGHC